MKPSLLLLLLAAAAAIGAESAARWRLQYFYDKDDSAFTITDIRFSSAERGIGVGSVSSKRDKPKGMSVITRDGGLHWTEVPLKEIPVSVFLLSDNLGFLVTEKGLWQTDEAGRTWRKINNTSGMIRVHFADDKHGWAVGFQKMFRETKDGGKTWTDVPAGKEPQSSPENTFYDFIEFSGANTAIVHGVSIPPRRERIPTWMDPDSLSKRREWPNLNIGLQTSDGGFTWKTQTAPLFGRMSRVKLSPEGYVLNLFNFQNTFQWPAEVMLMSRGKSTRIFRQKDRNVTDLAWFGDGVILAAVEPQTRLHQLPIPGKIHVLKSTSLTEWTEMKVDYKAFGSKAVLATFGDQAWLATDSGQILKLR